MKILALAGSAAILTLVAAPAFAQSDDAAEQRARLANQRIAAEAERRADEERRAEEARLAEEARRREEAAASAEASQGNAPGLDTPPGRADMHRVLLQLRELGELRDAGYLTEDEFAALKQKILDGAL